MLEGTLGAHGVPLMGSTNSPNKPIRCDGLIGAHTHSRGASKKPGAWRRERGDVPLEQHIHKVDGWGPASHALRGGGSEWDCLRQGLVFVSVAPPPERRSHFKLEAPTERR